MSRPPATSRKVRLVLALLALLLACQRATQTARASLGAGAVPFPRSVPPRAWARNLLVARRAKADGTLGRGKAEDHEDVKAAKEKDDVEEATTEVSRKKAVDEAASAQTADPVEDAKQASEPSESEDDEDKEQAASAQTADPVEDAPKDEQLQKTALENEDLAAALRARDRAEKAVTRADNAVTRLDSVVAALLEQWLQASRTNNNKKADEVWAKVEDAETKLEDAETKLNVAKQELNDAKQEYEQAIASAPAGPAQASIKTALMSGLKYRDPSPLLGTVGASWDYVGIEDLQKQLRKPLTELCQNKGHGEDKMSHPLFLVVAAPGQGKSRFLQEFHGLAEETGLIGSSPYGQRFLQFLLTLENGQKVDLTYDDSPETILASRMLWQLLVNADFRRFGWAGLPTNFTFQQLRRAVGTEGIVVDDVIQALEKGEGLSGAKWSLSLALDGLHNLPGSEDMSSKNTTFYQTMQAVCQQVNREMGPLVVAVISATTRVGVESSLADSPQQRTFIRLPRVEVVQRNGTDVFNFSGNKILELVQSDMGGHGRALEQLERIGIQNPKSAENVVARVRDALFNAYPSAIPTEFLPVLKAALAGKWLKRGETVGGQNPEKLQLVQLEYSSSGKLVRLLLPYIWIHLALVEEQQLQDWALLDYRDISDKPDPNGFDWETFLVRFRALKSLVWNDGENVSLSDLHAGALINPSAFGGRCVKNRPLQIVTAKGWTATNAQHFGLKKGQGGTIGPDGQTALGGEELQNGNYSYIVRNAKSAPAADFAALLEDASGKPFSECGQAKQGQANVDNQVMQDERAKSCDADDVLILFCTEEKHIQQQDLPPMTGIVQPAQWREYFGPYVGRAWAMQQDSRTP